MGVPEDDGPQSGAELDVLVAVDVPDVGPLAPVDHGSHVGRVLVGALGVGVCAAGDELLEAPRRLEGLAHGAGRAVRGQRRAMSLSMTSGTSSARTRGPGAEGERQTAHGLQPVW